MSTLRTHFTFRVDTWTSNGESIVEHVAGIEDYQVALATYRAVCERWPGIHGVCGAKAQDGSPGNLGDPVHVRVRANRQFG